MIMISLKHDEQLHWTAAPPYFHWYRSHYYSQSYISCHLVWVQFNWFPQFLTYTFFSSFFLLSTLTLPLSSFIPVSLQPTPVILLKEGTDTSQGIPQLISNINACQVRKIALLSLVLCCVFFPLCGMCVIKHALNLLGFVLQVIAEAVRTTLGPRGMDKLMVDGRGEERRLDKDLRNGLLGEFNLTKYLIDCVLQVKPQSPMMEPPSWDCWMWFTLQPRPWSTSLAPRMLRWEVCVGFKMCCFCFN